MSVGKAGTGGDDWEVPGRFRLQLFVAGSTARSSRAIANTRRFCEENLRGNYDLEIIDICIHPEQAVSFQIVAAPTLIKVQPLPLRRFVGEMADTAKVARGMGLATE